LPGLLYVNLHVFLRFVLGDKLFCKLGQEWLPKQISSVSGAPGEMAGKTIGIVEVMALLLLDLVLFLSILSIITIIVWIADSLVVKILATGAEVWEWISGAWD